MIPCKLVKVCRPDTLMSQRSQILTPTEEWEDNLASVAQTAMRDLAKHLVVLQHLPSPQMCGYSPNPPVALV
jgi:hypothetical protein